MLKASGVYGELRYGYHVAARLASWSIQDGRVDARVIERDTFWLETGGPFTLALQDGSRFWIWTDVAISRIDPVVAHVTGAPVVK